MVSGRGLAEDLDALFRAKLESSGLTLADAARLRMLVIGVDVVIDRKLWPSFPKTPALEIQYTDPWTNIVDFSRYRSLRDPKPCPPRFPKYVQPRGSAVHAYFPSSVPDWPEILGDPTRQLIITEGELKAAKACKEGFIAIGLGGVWNFRQQKVFLASLSKIAWEGRLVHIAYDSDAAINEQVERARQELANTLIISGAVVYRVDMPSLGGPKTGLDDYLIAQGPKAFTLLLKSATLMTVDWTLFYQWGESGPIPNMANVVTALSHAPELQGLIGYDEMRGGKSIMRASLGDDADSFPRLFRDVDANLITAWLQKNGKILRVSLDTVRHGLDIVSHTNSYHPIRDWLHSLSWDGDKRKNLWLTKVFGVEASIYSAKVGSMFLIAMCARVMIPGCKMDYMLVIDGLQGIKKSSALNILAGGWFSDSLPRLGLDEKRLSMHIQGKWLIEDAELSGRGRASIEELKQFISRRSERYTRMYGREEVVEDRQCVFVGTTNEKIFLNDDTGNRRFWPVTATFDEADDQWLIENRDQLFAEAFAAFKAGEHWWPDRAFEEKYILPEQTARFSGGEWDTAVAEYLEIKLIEREPRVTTAETLEFALGILPKDIRPGATIKISNVFRRLGWVSIRSNGIRWYVPGPGVRRKKF